MVIAATIIIDGIPIPDDRPIFLGVLAVHVVAGAVAVIAGAITAFARKRPGVHPRLGRGYFVALSVVFVSLVVLSILRWPHNTHLLLIGTATYAFALTGVLARRHRWNRWMLVHGTCMGLAYIGLLTGFYVDNGPNLPLWRDLPAFTHWLLPAAVGVPILVLALRRNLRPRRPAASRAGEPA